jgi:predicted GNAT family acetyltransferase
MFQPAPETPSLSVATLDDGASLAAIRQHMDTNGRGFAPDAPATTDAAAEEFRRALTASRAFTAYLDGRAAGAGMFTAPLGGITELAGIATLEQFRGRGVATALSAHATRTAFDQGVEVVFLSAADARAGRVYQRVGFQPFATMLAYMLEG